MRRWHSWILTALVAAGPLPAAGPPARILLTPEKVAKVKERNACVAEFNRRFQAGDMSGALTSCGQVVALDRTLYGAHPKILPTLRALGTTQEWTGDWVAARRSHEEALAIAITLYGEHDWRTTDVRLDLAGTGRIIRLSLPQRQRLGGVRRLRTQAIEKYHKGQVKEALSLMKEAYTIRREALGWNDPSTFSLGQEYAQVCWRAGDRKQALALLQTAIQHIRAIQGPNHPDYPAALSRLARMYKEAGQFDQARPLIERVVEARRLLEDPEQLLAALRSLAILHHDRGDPRPGLPPAREAVEMARRHLGEKHADYASALNVLGSIYQSLGDLDQAREQYERAAAVGPDTPSYLIVLSNLGTVLPHLGEYKKACELLEKVIAIRRKDLKTYGASLARSLASLGGTLDEIGEHARARLALEEAEKLGRKHLGVLDSHYARILTLLATHYKDTGERGEAKKLYERALTISRVTVGEKHPGYANTLTNLATLFFDEEDITAAVKLQAQAVRIYAEALGQSHPHTIHSLGNLAQMLYLAGETASSRKILEAVDRAWQKRGESRQPAGLTVRVALAHLAHIDGDSPQAARRLETLISELRNAVGEKQNIVADCLVVLGAVYRESGKFKEAADSLARALDSRRAHVHDTFFVQPDRQRLELVGSVASTLDAYLSLAQDARLGAKEIYPRVLAFKGLLPDLATEAQASVGNPRVAAAAQRLRRARADLARQANQSPGDDAEAWQRAIDELEKRKESAEVDLARASPAVGRLRQRFDAETVARRLPAGTALVEYVEYVHRSPPPKRGQFYRRQSELLAFVLTRDRTPVVVTLGKTGPIYQAIRVWRGAVTAGEAPPSDAAGTLREKLWRPVQTHLAGVRTVLIAPDGELCGLPFAALPGEKRGSFLVEELAIGYLTSGRQLLLRGDEPPSASGLLVLGGLGFGGDAAPGAQRRRNSSWADLPGAALEAHLVERTFRALHPRAPTHRLEKGDRSSLLAELTSTDTQRWRYLHLATHAWFEIPPARSPEALAAAFVGVSILPANFLSALPILAAAEESPDASKRSGLGQERPRRLFDRNPLLCAGLVLAGANRNPDRGYLTAEEIVGLDLRGCELAVLSACETGMGRMTGWQGVQGLQQAFHLAGAGSVMASLWSVNDPATSVIMEEFYEGLWRRKLSPLEALRHAQVVVLRDPGRVRRRAEELAAQLRKRGVPADTLASRGIRPRVATVGGGKGVVAEVAPPAWWAPWVLSGAR